MTGLLLDGAYPATTVGWLAIAIGLTGLASLLFGMLAFLSGPRFGRIGDVLEVLTSVLSVGLAMTVFPEARAIEARGAALGLGLAIAGGSLAAFGALLAASEVISWFRSQLYVAMGYALIGGWLLMLNVAVREASTFPNRAVHMGIFAGTVMLLGLTAAPGIIAAAETERTAPWLSRNIGRAGYLGWSILYPIWCLWLGQSRL